MHNRNRSLSSKGLCSLAFYLPSVQPNVTGMGRDKGGKFYFVVLSC
ncbi:MAG: hypothetical protein NQ127_00685 [Candidatus Cardinium sp.]|nr:hypothetical protein [Candidatus Cardinium sp.]